MQDPAKARTPMQHNYFLLALPKTAEEREIKEFADAAPPSRFDSHWLK
jgi:hypothetical protein